MRRTCQCQDDLILTPLTQGYLKVRGFPGGSDGKESACHVEGPGSVCGLGRSLGEGNGYPLQCSCLENPMDRGAWRNSVHGVAKSQMRLTLTLSTKVIAIFFRNVCPILKWNIEIRGLKGSEWYLFVFYTMTVNTETEILCFCLCYCLLRLHSSSRESLCTDLVLFRLKEE